MLQYHLSSQSLAKKLIVLDLKVGLEMYSLARQLESI